jgi:F-type H+-transporting ATPase subunit delta
MIVSGLASRYAKAIYEVATEKKVVDKVFSDLRELDQVFSRDKEIQDYLSSPLVATDEREALVSKAMQNSGVSDEVKELLVLLSRNKRFALFAQIVQSFQDQTDNANSVVRGNVRSASVLAPEERQKIERIVEKVLNKKVIMTYKVDASLLGGLVAQVGSYTFDDSLDSHLRQMNDELKRRTV